MFLVAFKLSLQISGGDAYWKEKQRPWSKVHLIEGLPLIGFELIWALAVFFFLSIFFFRTTLDVFEAKPKNAEKQGWLHA